MQARIGKLKSELAEIRNQAVTAHIAGDKAKADCLTGKAVGMKSALEIAERVLKTHDYEAVGELEGMERVIEALSPLPKCNAN
jgi:uncharacterized protein with von Willebrand factor type A (vWA) domain